MKMNFKALLFLSVAAFGCLSAQDNKSDDNEPKEKKSKILTGLYVGSYFANKYSASTYNGYGFDLDGNRNTFLNSFMYQKIVNEYGGGYGQYDQIADALGVDQKQWVFSESDMPVNMHYMPGIMVGLNLKFPLEKRGSFIFNLNGSKIGVEGNFTITTLRPQNTNPALNNNIQTFAITGKEQRLQIQFGYQQIFGDENEKLNFFGELGVNGTLSKFDQNRIYINGLVIDLTQYINQTLYPAPPPTRRPVGFGMGAFAGLGINLDMGRNFNIQLLYQLSHEKVNIGTNPTLKLQNALGLRIYYKLYKVAKD